MTEQVHLLLLSLLLREKSQVFSSSPLLYMYYPPPPPARFSRMTAFHGKKKFKKNRGIFGYHGCNHCRERMKKILMPWSDSLGISSMPFLSWLRISELCAASDTAVLQKCCPPSQNPTTSSSLHKAVSHLPGVALQSSTGTQSIAYGSTTSLPTCCIEGWRF